MSEPIVADVVEVEPVNFAEQWVCLHRNWNRTKPTPPNSDWRIARLPSTDEIAKRKAAEALRAELWEKATELAKCWNYRYRLNEDGRVRADALARDILAAKEARS